MDEFQFIRLNTVFLPDDQLLSLSLNLAEQITKGREVRYQLDNQKYLAHLTIYAPEYPMKNYYQVLSVVNDFAEKSQPTILTFDSFYVGWNYVGIIFKKTIELQEMHERLVSLLNPLREGRLRESYKEEIPAGKYAPDQVTYIQQYGYHNVLSAFEPHLTLARFANDIDAQVMAEKLNATVKIPDSSVFKIGVCETGPNGTCTKLLQEFFLGKDQAGQPLL